MRSGESRGRSSLSVILDIGYSNTMDLILAYAASLLLLVVWGISLTFGSTISP